MTRTLTIFHSEPATLSKLSQKLMLTGGQAGTMASRACSPRITLSVYRPIPRSLRKQRLIILPRLHLTYYTSLLWDRRRDTVPLLAIQLFIPCLSTSTAPACSDSGDHPSHRRGAQEVQVRRGRPEEYCQSSISAHRSSNAECMSSWPTLLSEELDLEQVCCHFTTFSFDSDPFQGPLSEVGSSTLSSKRNLSFTSLVWTFTQI